VTGHAETDLGVRNAWAWDGDGRGLNLRSAVNAMPGRVRVFGSNPRIGMTIDGRFASHRRFQRIVSPLRNGSPPSPSGACSTLCHEPGHTSINIMSSSDYKRPMSPLYLDESHTPSSSQLDLHPDSPRFIPLRFVSKRRRFVIATGSALSVLSLLLLSYLSFSRRPFVSQESLLQPVDTSSWDRKSVLLGPPTDRFRGSFMSITQAHPPIFTSILT